ncbi:transketolase [Phormidium pseudopriestleyi FRX01]|uniref:Transketolase n=1 Tax=Phormidium pseudopriestleyi FRX01 TaxID=1759528 RepID=A0ABS3FWB4_9CYAN|nr:transketolase [Phormidium pseudopriestleyi]MBO0350652.1 transketolase [Phormidium pseudopriestleyi FRX01]
MDIRSKHLRTLIVDALVGGGRGHIGSSMSMVEILRTLYDSFLHYRSTEPYWNDRDRLILSKGHGCLALYAILADKGFFPQEELTTFCQPTSRLGGHPEKGKLPGIEASTGALGHGLPMGVGMALAAKIRKQSYRVVVITGDGEINEGSVWEAAMSAAKHQLSNLSVFVDYNKLQSYGSTQEVLDLEPLIDKWRSFGFEVEEIDGHDVHALEQLMQRLPLSDRKPTAIICHTIKGKGFPFAEGQAEWHHKSRLKKEEIAAMYECLR